MPESIKAIRFKSLRHIWQNSSPGKTKEAKKCPDNLFRLIEHGTINNRHMLIIVSRRQGYLFLSNSVLILFYTVILTANILVLLVFCFGYRIK